MFSNASTAWDYYDGWVFVAHAPGRMVEADFDGYLADMLPRSELKGVVVRAANGAPTPNQRAQCQHWFEQNRRRGAVLTDSMLARGGVTALRWFGLNLRAFALNDLNAALEFVGVHPLDLDKARARLRQVIMAADALARVSA
jgi:hypothetical protein